MVSDNTKENNALKLIDVISKKSQWYKINDGDFIMVEPQSKEWFFEINNNVIFYRYGLDTKFKKYMGITEEEFETAVKKWAEKSTGIELKRAYEISPNEESINSVINKVMGKNDVLFKDSDLKEDIQTSLDFDYDDDDSGNEEIDNSLSKLKVDKKLVRDRLFSLGDFLTRNEGLGIYKKVMDVIKPNMTSIDPGTQKTAIKYATIFYNLGKLTERQLSNFIRKTNSAKMVFIDGEYHPVNKVNTNFNLWSKLLTDILIENNFDDALQDIMRNDDKKVLKDLMMSHRKELLDIIQNKYTFEDYLDIADKNIKFTDRSGNYVERKCAKWLEDKGFRIMRRGGDADPLDMYLGVDFVTSYNKKIYNVQVKRYENQANNFIHHYKRGEYPAVDLLMYLKNNEVQIVKLWTL